MSIVVFVDSEIYRISRAEGYVERKKTCLLRDS